MLSLFLNCMTDSKLSAFSAGIESVFSSMVRSYGVEDGVRWGLGMVVDIAVGLRWGLRWGLDMESVFSSMVRSYRV